MSKPLVSVIMPVYNAEKYLTAAMQSILQQTLTDFEFIIINDASTDRSKEIIHAAKDTRIQYWENEKNEGYIFSLNKALALAKGTYIARMDADDISQPERFSHQYDFLQQHSQIDLVGSAVTIDRGGAPAKATEIWDYPVTSGGVKARLLFNTAHAHPVVFFRRSLIDKGLYRYDPAYYPAEDYRLWINLQEYVNTANLEESLLTYRITSSQTSSVANEKQMHYASQLRASYFCQLLPHRFAWDEKMAYEFWHSGFRVEPAWASQLFDGYESIYCAATDFAFKHELGKNIHQLMSRVYQRQPQLIDAYNQSLFSRDFPLAWKDKIKFKLYRQGKRMKQFLLK